MKITGRPRPEVFTEKALRDDMLDVFRRADAAEDDGLEYLVVTGGKTGRGRL